MGPAAIGGAGVPPPQQHLLFRPKLSHSKKDGAAHRQQPRVQQKPRLACVLTAPWPAAAQVAVRTGLMGAVQPVHVGVGGEGQCVSGDGEDVRGRHPSQVAGEIYLQLQK